MLTIRVISYKDAPVDTPVSAEFREEGGTIGRSPDCTLVLPDPDRIISRTHATVVHAAGRYMLRDQGSTVPVVVNGAQVGKGKEAALASGDEVRIAGYLLLAEAPSTVDLRRRHHHDHARGHDAVVVGGRPVGQREPHLLRHRSRAGGLEFGAAPRHPRGRRKRRAPRRRRHRRL